MNKTPTKTAIIQSRSLVLLSCSNRKRTERQRTFAGLKGLGARSIHEFLTRSIRELLFDRRRAIRRLLKGDAARLYNADQKGGFRDERPCNRRLAEGPEFGGGDPGEAIYLPAYERYSEGRFFARLTAAAPSFWEKLPQSTEIVFVSALYGLLLWNEPIQDYDCHFADYQDDAQRTAIQEVWAGALTQVLCDFLAHYSPPVTKVYDLLSEAVYQNAFDWDATKGVKAYHRIFRGVSGPDALTRSATILAGSIARFCEGSGSYEHAWYTLPADRGADLEFGFESNIGDDKTATRELHSDPEGIRLIQEALEKELEALKRELKDYGELLAEAERERDEAQADSRKEKGQVAVARQQVEDREARIARLERQLDAIQIPGSLEPHTFRAWCESKLVGKVVVHERAYDGVRQSVYRDKALIYKALLLLRDLYVPMRRQGGAEAKGNFQRACRDLGLVESLTGELPSPSIYVGHAGVTRRLDNHLKRGVSSEPRYCFRLYFFWDEASEQVVVGWLTSHL
ncbi:MAG: hypothetical protein WCE23_10925 [Candidatus Binatus sp.]|uniref:hypothetical protein n=1 Tax=Candidatus Binatus sp. TaxID=2811406 RepID=UPI003C787E1A